MGSHVESRGYGATIIAADAPGDRPRGARLPAETSSVLNTLAVLANEPPGELSRVLARCVRTGRVVLDGRRPALRRPNQRFVRDAFALLRGDLGLVRVDLVLPRAEAPLLLVAAGVCGLRAVELRPRRDVDPF